MNENRKQKIGVLLYAVFMTAIFLCTSYYSVSYSGSALYIPKLLISAYVVIGIFSTCLLSLIYKTHQYVISIINSILTIIITLGIFYIIGLLGLGLSQHGADFIAVISIGYTLLASIYLWFTCGRLLLKHRFGSGLTLIKFGCFALMIGFALLLIAEGVAIYI